MTQEQKDLVDRLIDTDKVYAFDKFHILDCVSVRKGSIIEIDIWDKELNKTYTLGETNYGRYWAFTKEELIKLRKENEKVQLEETIKDCQIRLKELEENNEMS